MIFLTIFNLLNEAEPYYIYLNISLMIIGILTLSTLHKFIFMKYVTVLAIAIHLTLVFNKFLPYLFENCTTQYRGLNASQFAILITWMWNLVLYVNL